MREKRTHRDVLLIRVSLIFALPRHVKSPLPTHVQRDQQPGWNDKCFSSGALSARFTRLTRSIGLAIRAGSGPAWPPSETRWLRRSWSQLERGKGSGRSRDGIGPRRLSTSTKQQLNTYSPFTHHLHMQSLTMSRARHFSSLLTLHGP